MTLPDRQSSTDRTIGWWGTIRTALVEVAPVEVAAVDVPRRGRGATV
jgi:hypothetical protein